MSDAPDLGATASSPAPAPTAVVARDATAADRPGLLDVLTADVTFVESERSVALELIDAALAGSPDYALLIAEHPRRAVAGYLCYGPTPMTAGTFDLYWLVVHPQQRGAGIAGALVSAMEARLRQRGASAVRVETSETESYGAARKLYQRLGYPIASVLPDFYREGDALITYYKKL
ncbi:MAG: N-acetyltransferase [Kofleriaceae bacterium]